jgi:CRISPR system Cascade subunit CasB
MTQTTTPYLEREISFLTSLQKRTENDNGAKAALKRALSGEPRHFRNVYSLILPYLEGIPKWQQDHWLFVASLSVYYPQSIKENHRDFGHSCRQLANKTESGGTERRFKALLDTAIADLHLPIAALIRQLKSKEVSIDYPKLIADVCRWDHPDQYIQDQWARTFWGAIPDTSK